MSQNGETAEFDKAQPQDTSVVTGSVNRLDSPTDREQATILHGQDAWHRLGQDHTWENWRQVGAAVGIGRRGAMREAAVNGRLAVDTMSCSPLGSANLISTISTRLIAPGCSRLWVTLRRSKPGARP
jgi:hypothetical protein